jgi:hypothetical protein
MVVIRATRLDKKLPFGLLFNGSGKFLVENSSQKSVDNLVYFCLKQVFLHFHLIKQFQSMVCCWYFKSSKVIYCICFWTFKLSLDVDILTFLATFSKIWANFSQSSGHPARNIKNLN